MKPIALCSYHEVSKPVMAFILLLALASVNLRALNRTLEGQPAYLLKDSVKYESFSGRVLDKSTNKPVIFADIQLKESNVGVVTNSDGDFLIKVPSNMVNQKLAINHLGYKNAEVDLSQLNKSLNIIYLEAAVFPIEEVKIRKNDPEDLLRAAMRNKSVNYSNDPVMMTSFYRETIKQNKNYVAVAEAVIDIYKAPYYKTTESDRSKIFKGRKSQDVKKMDTVIVKMQGGPYTSLLLDIVKNPGDILSQDLFELYDYKLEGINYINDRQAYVISFKQKENVSEPLYEGKIYLDFENLAVTGLDFNLNTQNIDKATNLLVRKKPAAMKIDVLGANYLTRYRELNGTWHLSYVRSELQLKCKWDKKVFSSIFTLMSEMAVTDMDENNVDKLKFKDQAKYSDILAEQVSQFEDPDYWGDYNIIKPDESIEAAIDKLNRRLKKQM
jgi:hypothetical protein